jgi:hypothetical protein
LSSKKGISMQPPNAPARPAQPAQPYGGHGRRRRRSSGGALIQGSAPAALPYIATRRPGCGAEIFLPSSGGAVVVASATPFGTPGAWSAIGTPANDLYLTRLYARRDNTWGTVGQPIAIEWGYGAGPTSIDIQRGAVMMTDPAADDAGYPWNDRTTFHTRVPAGQSLQARVNEGVSKNWRLMAVGWDTDVPTFTTLNVDRPAGAGRFYPSNYSTAGITSTAGIMPAYGAWVTVVDPAPNDMLVTEALGGFLSSSITVTGAAIQLGIGAAGSEQPVATVIHGRGNNMAPLWPPVWVLAGERLALRTSYIAAVTQAYFVKVIDL